MSFYIATVIFILLSLVLIKPWLDFKYGIIILLIKFGIPMLFYVGNYGYIIDLNLVIYDSWYDQSTHILDAGNDPITLLLNNFDGIGSNTPFYWWWTALWITYIDDSVYGPIIANVFVTVIGSVAATRILAEINFTYRYQQLFLTFSLLHWDILTWSTLINHREKIMATVTILIFLFSIQFIKSKTPQEKIFPLIGLSIALWIMRLNRDYLLVAVLATLGIWIICEYFNTYDINRAKFGLLASIFIVVGIISWIIYGNEFLARFTIDGLLRGFIRYPTGPTFWNLDSQWRWLLPTTIIHWVFIPTILIGAAKLVTNKYARLLFIYVIIIWCIYAIGQVSPQRFRFQLIYIVSIFQFYGVWWLIRKKYKVSVVSGISNIGSKTQ